MSSFYCPLGRITCYQCYWYNGVNCTYRESTAAGARSAIQRPSINQTGITAEQQEKVVQNQREELMKMSKEELVDLILDAKQVLFGCETEFRKTKDKE